MVIRSIRVKNFKSIKDSGPIELTKLFALIGKNNSGKSALIDALRVVFGDRSISTEDFHKKNSDTIEIILRLALNQEASAEEESTVTLQCPHSTDPKPIYLDSNGDQQRGAGLTTLKKSWPRLFFIPAIRNPANETTAGAKSHLKELIAEILKSSDDDEANREFLGLPAEKLSRQQLLSLFNQKTKEELAKLSGRLTDNFRLAIDDPEIALEIDPDTDPFKALFYSTSLIDPSLGDKMRGADILQCGTGLQSMAILALLQTYAQGETDRNVLLIVEEPEVYLHPALQRKMATALREIARHNQVIFTTHSPIMISDLWAEKSIRFVRREKGVSSFVQINVPDIVSELGVRFDDILNARNVVFVEGIDDVRFYKALANRIGKGREFDSKAHLVDADGYRKIHAYALMHILGSHNVSCGVKAVTDGDADDPTARKQKIRLDIQRHLHPSFRGKLMEGLEIHVLGKYEIESCLLAPEILSILLPQTPKESLKKHIEFYETILHTAFTGLKKTPSNKSRIQTYLKPSLLFASRPSEHDKFREAYIKEFNNNSEFIGFRGNLIESWGKWRKKHQEDVFQKLFAKLDVKKIPTLKPALEIVEALCS